MIMNFVKLESICQRTRYPAGESHVELLPQKLPKGSLTIQANCRTFEDLAELLTIQALFERRRIQVSWLVPYFPFARHDRRNHAWDGCELEVALRLVSNLDLTVVDPHSDVTARLRHYPQSEVVDILERHKNIFAPQSLVVIPDLGATKKAKTWLCGRDFVQASKTRDPKTGELSGFSIPTDQLQGRPCTIVDDICDGGRTFLGLASILKELGAGPLTLAVSHGLFTKGTDALFEHFSRIVCLGQSACPRVEALPYQELYQQGKTI